MISLQRKRFIGCYQSSKEKQEKADEYFSDEDEESNTKEELEEEDFSFFPTTFDFSVADHLRFIKTMSSEGSTSLPWIVKPIAMNRGRGIKFYPNAKPICNELLVHLLQMIYHNTKGKLINGLGPLK